MNRSSIILAIEQGHFEQDEVAIAGGRLSVFTAKAPSRTGANEDAVGVLPMDDRTGVVVLADGAGGQPEGARAARLAVEAMEKSLAQGGNGDQGLRAAILEGIENANRTLLDQRPPLGTTLEVLEILGDTIRAYHIGDSSILVVGGRGKIKYQTVAQSPVGYAVEAGLVGQEEALFHEDLHLVSNLLGTQDMKIEIGPALSLKPRDTVLVASDGLTDNLRLEEIAGVIRKGPLSRARRTLVEMSRRRMLEPSSEQPSKEDDLSFVLYRRC